MVGQRVFTNSFDPNIFIIKDGKKIERKSGTPQGGVISPVLANMYLHYVFDMWMKRNFPKAPFERYADDGIIHCRTKEGGYVHQTNHQAPSGGCCRRYGKRSTGGVHLRKSLRGYGVYEPA